MSQSKQRSITSYFSPSPARVDTSANVSSSKIGAGDRQDGTSPNENVQRKANQTPVSGAKRAKAGINLFDDPCDPANDLKCSDEDVQVRKKKRVLDLDDSSDEESGKKSRIETQPVAQSGVSGSAIVSGSNYDLAGRQSALIRSLPTIPSIGVEEIPPEESEWPPKDIRFNFLRPEQIRDADRRRPTDPDFDPTTLFVPKEFLNSLTQAQQQWWSHKSRHFDTILFFKVGKFYELFNMDSLIGIEELNLLPMGGSNLHCGFPEKSCQKYMERLVERGYRVARIEQTESNAARDQRLSTSGGCRANQEKVVRREVCEIVTPATLRFSSNIDTDNSAKYLLAFTQQELDPEERSYGTSRFLFGVCFVDTTIGLFKIGQFEDDRSCSRLQTLVAQYPPAEVLIERKRLTAEAEAVLKMWMPTAIVRSMIPGKQFYSTSDTLKHLSNGQYFSEKGYPDELVKMLDPADVLNQTARHEYSAAIKALGGILFYLKNCLIDEELLTLRQFERYIPADEATPVPGNRNVMSESMILDSLTLHHLDILDSEAGPSFSLFSVLNFTQTKPGQRMLRSWLSFPLTSVRLIENRLDAIEDLSTLINSGDESLFAFMQKIPDIEKLLSQIHTQGLKRKNDHPDTRAQMFEDYDTRKLNALSELIGVFETIEKGVKKIRNRSSCFSSTLLKSLISSEPAGGQFPALDTVLQEFRDKHDVDDFTQKGQVKASENTSPEYAKVKMQMQQIIDHLEEIRLRESENFGCTLKWKTSFKKKYMLEASNAAYTRMNPGSRYKFQGSNKTTTTFYVPEILDLLPQLEMLQEREEFLNSDALRQMFADFDSHFVVWNKAVKCIATLDALLSLTRARLSLMAQSIPMCRPVFVQSDTPILDIRSGKHPILAKTNPLFVPNDLMIDDRLVILTGPNMGGKSTLMRQTGLIAIMAQIGSFTPAEEVRMTPVDRVFTRLGAMDRIMEGESTFFVEMSETSVILRHVTPHSLVLLDELGRGTSTHDGTAIAYAVVRGLSDKTRCRTLFSTHYHNLVQEFSGSERVTACHMDCYVSTDLGTSGSEDVTFLYRVKSGSCPKSYGFNVARKAGIPEPVIRDAQTAAERLEKEVEKKKEITRLLSQLRMSGPEAPVHHMRPLLEQVKRLTVSSH